MSDDPRDQRLETEAELLSALAAASPVMRLEFEGKTPQRYRIEFQGKGYCKDPTRPDEVGTVDRHEVELVLGTGFPESPPDIRWMTSLYHPNVSTSGYLTVRDIGCEWSEKLSLDLVCERLWDVARGAYVNEQRVSSPAAMAWYRKEGEELGAADRRPLVDRNAGNASNIISYQRRPKAGDREPVLAQKPSAPPALPPEVQTPNNGIQFIEEDPPKRRHQRPVEQQRSAEPLIVEDREKPPQDIWFVD